MRSYFVYLTLNIIFSVVNKARSTRYRLYRCTGITGGDAAVRTCNTFSPGIFVFGHSEVNGWKGWGQHPSIHSPKDEKLTWQSIETLMPSLRPVLLPLLCQLSARRQILQRCLAQLPLQSHFQIAHPFRNLVVGFCWIESSGFQFCGFADTEGIDGSWGRIRLRCDLEWLALRWWQSGRRCGSLGQSIETLMPWLRAPSVATSALPTVCKAPNSPSLPLTIITTSIPLPNCACVSKFGCRILLEGVRQ